MSKKRIRESARVLRRVRDALEGPYTAVAMAVAVTCCGIALPTFAQEGVTAVPAAPSGLWVDDLGQTDLIVRWSDNSNNEDNFHISQEDPNYSGQWDRIGTVDANVTGFRVSGLTAGTLYRFRVRAQNESGYSAHSEILGVTTLPETPNAPSSLMATDITFTTVSLSWQDNSNNEATFQIQHRNNRIDPDTWLDRGVVGANITNFTDTSLSPNTSYSFRVRAHNSGGNSAWSNVINLGTPQNPPAAPSGLTASQITSTSLRLDWTDNASNEDDFRVYQLDQGEPDLPENWNEIGAPNSDITFWNVTGLSPATQYWFKVRARNGGGYSAYTGTVSITTLPLPPSAPSLLIATEITLTTVSLSWQDNSSNEATFQIQHRNNRIDPDTWLDRGAVGANITNFTDTSLSPNTSYSFRVRAHNSGGNSAWSNVINLGTPQNPPAAPSGLTASQITPTSLRLDWTDNASNEDDFRVYRLDQGEPDVPENWNEIGAPNSDITFLDVSGLSPGTRYWFKVCARNGGGYSEYSNVLVVDIPDGTPAPPSNLRAGQIRMSNVSLRWNDNSEDEEGFNVSRLDPGENPDNPAHWDRIGTVAANVTTFVAEDLIPRTAYCFRVRGFNQWGNSDHSDTLWVGTLPGTPIAPTNLQILEAGETSIKLRWTDESSHEIGFDVLQAARSDGAPCSNCWNVAIHVAQNVESGRVGDLEPGQAYWFAVRAINAQGYSNLSNVIEYRCPGDGSVPDRPSDLVVTAMNAVSAHLQWTDLAVNEDEYTVAMYDSLIGDWAYLDSVDENSTECEIAGLEPGTQYNVAICATNEYGSSPWSNSVAFRTAGPVRLRYNVLPPLSGQYAVGDTVLVELALEGLGAGDTLQYFNVTADYDSLALDDIEFHPAATLPDSAAVGEFGDTGGLNFVYDVTDTTGLGIVRDGLLCTMTARACVSGLVSITGTELEVLYQHGDGGLPGAAVVDTGCEIRIDGVAAVGSEVRFASRIHPNPVVTTSVLMFLPVETGFATIKVFDLRGHKVGEVWSENVQKNFVSSVDFGSLLLRFNMPSGRYFARIENGDHFEVQPFSIVK